MFRRGFKKDSRELVDEVRKELKLTAYDPLDPKILAQNLEIPVMSLTDLIALNSTIREDANFLLLVNSDKFSAVTVFDGHRRGIIHNDAHAQVRQNSNLAHELAHVLLAHEPMPLLDDTGHRNWNPVIEEEAQWLAGELLIPEEAALAIARGKWSSIDEAARHFGVSKRMVDYRLKVTAAQLRILRMRAHWRQPTHY